MAIDEENNLVQEDIRVARLFLFTDWPEKFFSEGGISNASGTRSVRVSAQGLSRSCCKLSLMKIPSSQLAALGSPRMEFRWNTGGMPAIIRRNSCWKCPEFEGNTGGMPAIIPADSSGIPVESASNLHGNSEKSGLEFRRDSTGIPGLFLLGKLFKITHLYKNVTICTAEPR